MARRLLVIFAGFRTHKHRMAEDNSFPRASVDVGDVLVDSQVVAACVSEWLGKRKTGGMWDGSFDVRAHSPRSALAIYHRLLVYVPWWGWVHGLSTSTRSNDEGNERRLCHGAMADAPHIAARPLVIHLSAHCTRATRVCRHPSTPKVQVPRCRDGRKVGRQVFQPRGKHARVSQVHDVLFVSLALLRHHDVHTLTPHRTTT